MREDLNLEPVHPKPLSYRYSVREALPWITKAWEDTGGEWSSGDITERASVTVRAGGVGHLYTEAETDISRYAIGAEWDKLRPGEQSEKYFSLVKPGLNEPCPTVTQTAGITGAAGCGASDREAQVHHRRTQAYLRVPRRLRSHGQLRTTMGKAGAPPCPR